MKRFQLGLLAFLVMSLPLFAHSQDLMGIPQEMMLFPEFISLDSLLKEKIGVSTITELTAREAPGILTIITRDEIANSGARDLMDILRRVAAFDFGLDVNGMVFPIARGISSTDGRILLLIDGQQMTETLYGILMFGNRFSADSIEQIEIIRGPGSVIYGGNAELAVINVKTRSGKKLDGFSVTGTYGQLKKTYGRRNLSASLGKEAEGLDVSLHVFRGQGIRSNETYTSMFGGTFDMSSANKIDPLSYNFGLTYKGLEFRAIADLYRTTHQDWWGANLPGPVMGNYDLYSYDAKYTWQVTDQLKIIPRLTHREQNAYCRAGEGAESIIPELYSDPISLRQESPSYRETQSVLAVYDFMEKNNFLLGVETWQERTDFYELPFSLHFYNDAYFAQCLVDVYIANLTAGARYEHNSWAKDSFVPRIGLTRVIDQFHVKALYSRAFRSPNAFNLVNDVTPPYGVNSAIDPENAEISELEAGYQITPDMMLTLNLFDNTIRNFLVFSTLLNPGSESGTSYSNWEGVRNQGLELEYKFRQPWGFINVQYAYSTVIWNGAEGPLGVPDHPGRLLGAPQHKATLQSIIKVLDNLTINPEMIALGDRYGFYQDGASVKRFDPAVLVNLFLSYAPIRGLKIGLGVNDALDANPPYIQVYNDVHAPLPGLGRELFTKITYEMNF